MMRRLVRRLFPSIAVGHALVDRLNDLDRRMEMLERRSGVVPPSACPSTLFGEFPCVRERGHAGNHQFQL